MVTIGQRRLGKTIRKLEGSVEFSVKESNAKASEVKYNREAQAAQGYTDDSPIQNLRSIRIQRKDQSEKQI